MCQEISQAVVDDSMTVQRDGTYLEYSKTKIDEAYLEAVTEKYFLPWDKRHEVKEVKNK